MCGDLRLEFDKPEPRVLRARPQAEVLTVRGGVQVRDMRIDQLQPGDLCGFHCHEDDCETDLYSLRSIGPADGSEKRREPTYRSRTVSA